MSGVEGSIKPGVGSESLSCAVQQSHHGSPSSSDTAAWEMYGWRGVSRVDVVRRRLGCGGGACWGGLRRWEGCPMGWLVAVSCLSDRSPFGFGVVSRAVFGAGWFRSR